MVVWRALGRNWEQFGKVPVHVDYDNPSLCALDVVVTYEALVASGADVVILSDPVGAGATFTQDEADALLRYAQDGHNVIGTLLVLSSVRSDNRLLAPLFGLDASRDYGVDAAVSPTFHARAHSPLFEGVGRTYTTQGYTASQVLAGERWTNAAVGEDQIEAHDSGHHAAIVKHCGAGYRADLFTFMPEYYGGEQDMQVLYNAIVQGRDPGCKAH